MKTYGGWRSTTASPERVLALWSNPDNWSRWNIGIRSSQIDRPLTSGAIGRMQKTRGRRPSNLEVRNGILHAA